MLQFNLAIKDIPEVTHEAKKALAGQLPGIGRSMCVEISLKTSEVNPETSILLKNIRFRNNRFGCGLLSLVSNALYSAYLLVRLCVFVLLL